MASPMFDEDLIETVDTSLDLSLRERVDTRAETTREERDPEEDIVTVEVQALAPI